MKLVAEIFFSATAVQIREKYYEISSIRKAILEKTLLNLKMKVLIKQLRMQTR
jgi:hypothetical protein